MANEVKSWDRLPNESDKAYEAFRNFLNLGGERSLLKVAEKVSKSEGQIKKWSRKNFWRERAAAYDSSIVENERRQNVKRWETAIEKLWKLALLYADKAVEKMLKVDTERMSVRATIDMGVAAKELFNTIKELETSKGDTDKITSITIKKFEGGGGDF